MNVPIEQYVNHHVVREISSKLDLLEKIEPYKLPEIIKLISTSEDLISKFGLHYRIVGNVYAHYDCSDDKDINRPCIEYIEKLIQTSSVSSSFFIDEIFPYADKSILKSFMQVYTRLANKLNSLSKQKEDIERTESQIKDLEFEISIAQKELEIINEEDGIKKYSDLQKDIEKKKNKLSSVKKNAKDSQFYDDLLTQIQAIKELYEKFADADAEAQKIHMSIDEKISKDRNTVYKILSKDRNTVFKKNCKPLGAKAFIDEYRQSGEISEELKSI